MADVMNRFKKFLLNALVYIGGYEVIRQLWIIIDEFQGYEYRFEVSDAIATTVLAYLLTIWVLKKLESEGAGNEHR